MLVHVIRCFRKYFIINYNREAVMKRGVIFLALLFAVILQIGCGGGGGGDGGANPPSEPTISIASASVNEGDSGTTNLTFTISLSAVSTNDVTVDYATSNGSATAGSDYTATSGTATITAGSTSTTVVVSISGDTSVESNESFTLSLSNASGATLATASATGTINNDDGTPPQPNLSVNDASVTEGDSGTVNMTFTLSLSAASGSDVTVNYATSNGSATAGSDYTAANDTAMISAGNTSTTVSVSVMGDSTPESDETFTLTLSNASGATLVTATATGTIINDDASGGPFMLYGDPASGDLYAVDISDPASTFPVASGISGNATIGMEYSEMIITGDINVSTGTLNNFRPDTFVYFDAGKFWRIDLKPGSNLTPTQISNVDSGYICYMDVIDNVITPADSYIVFAQGVDANACATTGGQGYVIQVGDDSSVVPTAIPGAPHWGGVAVETMETGTTPGQVTGFLVRESYPDFSITRYDTSFSNPAILLDGSTQAIQIDPGARAPDGVSFYLVDGVIYSYTHDLVDTTVATMHTIPAGSSFDNISGDDLICTTTHCYFVEVNDTTGIQSLYMTAIDGSGSSLIGTAFNDNDILGLSLTSGRLYVSTTPKVGGGQSLNAVTVSGGTPAEVDSIATGYFTGMIGVGDNLYYNKIDESAGMTISATVLKDDNSVAVNPIANAAWVGFVFSSAQVNTVFEPSEVILAEDVTGPAGHRFTTYNATAATVGTVVGTLDGSFFLQNPAAAAGTFAYGIGDTIFGRTTFGNESNYQADVFLANKTIADSLQKVTDTASVNELPAF
jgi:hypothetical protein